MLVTAVVVVIVVGFCLIRPTDHDQPAEIGTISLSSSCAWVRHGLMGYCSENRKTTGNVGVGIGIGIAVDLAIAVGLAAVRIQRPTATAIATPIPTPVVFMRHRVRHRRVRDCFEPLKNQAWQPDRSSFCGRSRFIH